MGRSFFVVVAIASAVCFAYPAPESVELPTTAPITEKFTVKKSKDVVDIMKTNATSNHELVPVIKKIISSLNKNENISSDAQSMLEDMLVRFSHRSEHAAAENNKTLSEQDLKNVLANLGVKEGDVEYEVMKTRDGSVKIIVEEFETDDPTAKDQIILDYNKEVDKTVVVDGPEQEDTDTS